MSDIEEEVVVPKPKAKRVTKPKVVATPQPVAAPAPHIDKPKRKYTRKAKPVEEPKFTVRENELEPVVDDEDEIDLEDLKISKIPLRRSSAIKKQPVIEEEEEEPVVAPPPELPIFKANLTSAQEELMKGFRKPMLMKTDVFIYTDIISPDLEKLLKEVQDLFLQRGLGTQFQVYGDPQHPRFDNSYCITNLFVCENKSDPFWKFTLGDFGSKAVYIKEMPRLGAEELVKVIESYNDADKYSNEVLEMIIL